MACRFRWSAATALLLVLAACASRGTRPRPERIESCPAVFEKIRFRDQFFSALRGKASVQAQGYSVDAELALKSPDSARIEIRGPLGISLGLLMLNDKWIQFYVPRQGTLYRFPASELSKDTVRRERFLKLIPVPLLPDSSLDSLLTRIGLPDELKASECDYDPRENVYRLRLPRATGGRIVWVNPVDYSPIKIFFFDRGLPKLQGGPQRPLLIADFSKSVGNGPATLPRLIEIKDAAGQSGLHFQWQSAEAWTNVDPRVFEWEAPASATVHDF